jgi:hypothetical protein
LNTLGKRGIRGRELPNFKTRASPCFPLLDVINFSLSHDFEGWNPRFKGRTEGERRGATRERERERERGGGRQAT